MRLSKNHLFPIGLLFLLQILSQQKVLAEGESCKNTTNGQQGICINIKRCDLYVAILKKHGSKVADLLRGTLCYYNNQDPIVCCPARTSPKPQSQFQPQTRTNSIYGPLYKPQCGYSNTTRKTIATWGHVVADIGAWPWMAALGYGSEDPNQPKWLCDGSLISARHILTAAHCVYNRNDLYLARLGAHDLYNDKDGDYVDVLIERRIIHPDYNDVSYVNDIAVLRLEHEIPYTHAIHSICLPLPLEIRNNDYARHYPFFVEWRSAIHTRVLQQAMLRITSNEACQEALPMQIIDERVICVGFVRKIIHPYQNNSGGIMIFPKGKFHYVIGVPSFGFGSASSFGVYTRVTYFLDFIQRHLN